MVEFVIVIVLFFTIFFFAIQISYISIAKSLLNLASHGAARKFAASPLNYNAALQVAQRYLSPIASSENIHLYITNANDRFATPFQIRTSVRLKLLPLPFVNRFFIDQSIPDPATVCKVAYGPDVFDISKMVDANGNHFSLGPHQILTIKDKTFFAPGYDVWQYRITARSQRKLDPDGWFGYDWRYYPNPKPKDSSYHLHNSSSTTPPPAPPETGWYTVTLPTNSPAPTVEGTPEFTPYAKLWHYQKNTIYNAHIVQSVPATYEWHICITTEGQSVDENHDGYVTLHTWTAMTSD